MYEVIVFENSNEVVVDKYKHLFKKTENVVDAIYYAKGLIEDLYLKNDPKYKLMGAEVKEPAFGLVVYSASYKDGDFCQKTDLSAIKSLRERSTACAVRPRSFSPGAK